MNTIVLENINCDFCKSTSSTEVLNGVDWEFQFSTEAKVVKCQRCNLIWLNPRPDEASIKYVYPSIYGFYAEPLNPKYTLKGFMKNILDSLSPTPLQFVHLDKRKGNILDVGCATGSTLYPFGYKNSLHDLSRRGWNAYGCEISEDAASTGNESGLSIQPCSFESANFENNFFDVVRFNEVLEHSPSPLIDLTKASKLLKSDGILIISVPNINSAAFHLFGKYWAGLDLPRHTYFYTPETLKNYFDKLGFEILADCTDSTVPDFYHSLKHFLHSTIFNKKNLPCSTDNKLNEIYKGKKRSRLLLFLGLYPLVKYFNSVGLGESYTVICKKK
ncbi:class I SAM-dependent methyltransferase [Gammaproteobacteria bacterium]|nr:class I SAM-dependent methyltransferase [Gammaproteobacteria bacterium]